MIALRCRLIDHPVRRGLSGYLRLAAAELSQPPALRCLVKDATYVRGGHMPRPALRKHFLSRLRPAMIGRAAGY